MADIWTTQKRSDVMSRIRSKNTKPELLLRSLLHRDGYRFRVHRKDLPGKPDIVLPMYRTAVFVHGCFWHQHSGCIDGKMPKTRRDYWEPKLSRNVERDKKAEAKLKADGWCVVVVWECEIEKTPDDALLTVTKYLVTPKVEN